MNNIAQYQRLVISELFFHLLPAKLVCTSYVVRSHHCLIFRQGLLSSSINSINSFSNSSSISSGDGCVIYLFRTELLMSTASSLQQRRRGVIIRATFFTGFFRTSSPE